MKEITLFHGSDHTVSQPLPGIGREHNDFGQGFYCTESAELAAEWACTMDRSGFVNRYRFDADGLHVLHLNTPEHTILNWITVLVNHRLFRIKNPVAGRAKKYLTEQFYVNVSGYDVVTGYRADDSYYDFAEAFLNNAITVEQLAASMRLGKLGEQIVLKSKAAYDRICFESAYAVDHTVYYPKRKKRDDNAADAYRKLAGKDADGLYMIDILRMEVKNDDPRIPRNVSG